MRKSDGIFAIQSFENLRSGVTIWRLLPFVRFWIDTFSGMKNDTFAAQVVIKTANLVSDIVVQGSGGREIMVLNYLRAARLVFPIRPITSVICCFRRCLPKGPSLVIKSRVKSHFPLLFYA